MDVNEVDKPTCNWGAPSCTYNSPFLIRLCFPQGLGFFVAMFERKCRASTSFVDQETKSNIEKDERILKNKCKRKIVENKTKEKSRCTLLKKETEGDIIFQAKGQKLKKKRKMQKKPVT